MEQHIASMKRVLYAHTTHTHTFSFVQDIHSCRETSLWESVKEKHNMMPCVSSTHKCECKQASPTQNALQMNAMMYTGSEGKIVFRGCSCI